MRFVLMWCLWVRIGGPCPPIIRVLENHIRVSDSSHLSPSFIITSIITFLTIIQTYDENFHSFSVESHYGFRRWPFISLFCNYLSGLTLFTRLSNFNRVASSLGTPSSFTRYTDKDYILFIEFILKSFVSYGHTLGKRFNVLNSFNRNVWM